MVKFFSLESKCNKQSTELTSKLTEPHEKGMICIQFCRGSEGLTFFNVLSYAILARGSDPIVDHQLGHPRHSTAAADGRFKWFDTESRNNHHEIDA